MSSRTIHIDPRRGVIAMAGSDARAVLQGVVTNDMDRLAPGVPLYAALLTPQGKYLFDFFLIDTGEGRILIDVARDRGQDLARALMGYCLRRDARIVGTGAMEVGLCLGDGPQPSTSENVAVVPDPRDHALGWRLYGTDLAETLGACPLDTDTTAQLNTLRVRLGVPETGVELIPNDTFILEAGFERLAGVDFRKGCYVGQEVTARMKHKTELRKGLVQVAVRGWADPGTAVTLGGKPAGTLFTVVDGAGLAHLRFDRAGLGMTAGDAVVDYPG
ncbi:MAG: folate-binding protein YgfZ [Paracoccaceae bacterium]